MPLTQVNPGLLDTPAQYTGFKNRIINGDMRIDQRNAGAALTTTNGYPVDRWIMEDGCDAVLSGQRTTDVPSGAAFVNSLKVTATTADASIGATQFAVVTQIIEGFNTADLGFGTANAQSITVSFWVKASVTGTYSCTIYNAAANRINPQPYTINSANTWEYKTVTFSGDTTGTWVTDTGRGIVLNFYMALGSSYLGSSGWNGSSLYGVTGQANALASTNNIFAITGVQLEKGSTATSFDYRPYGTELALCQRYYLSYGGTANFETIGVGQAYGATGVWMPIAFPVQMRAFPSVAYTTLGLTNSASTTLAVTSLSQSYGGLNTAGLIIGVASGLTAGNATVLTANNSTSARLQFSAEL